MTDKNWDQLSSQLYKADYHGAKVRVVRSKCPSYVGVEGIVVMDTKNTFRILAQDNVVRSMTMFFYKSEVSFFISVFKRTGTQKIFVILQKK